MIYIDDPLSKVFESWINLGGQAWQLIEPVDGFHPSQLANKLMSEYIWDYLETNRPDFLPASNPNNEIIKNMFGDQGGN